MQVYAQPTDWNERLCSLLSAVLRRSIRPSFANAIWEKPKRLGILNNNSGKESIKILLVGDENDNLVLSLRKMLPDFGLRNRMQVTTIDTTIKDNGSTSIQ